MRGLRLSSGSVLESIEEREFAYLLSGTRLRAVQNIARLDVGSIHLESMNLGDVAELPRWIAEILIKLGLCESQEESFSSEVFKAVNREKMAGENQLAGLRSDFYLKVRRHLSFFGREPGSAKAPSSLAELERTKTLIYDLIALRLRKILMISASLSPPPDIKDKLTPEEQRIFEAVFTLLQSWRSVVMDGGEEVVGREAEKRAGGKEEKWSTPRPR